jgi:hypothetical protein
MRKVQHTIAHRKLLDPIKQGCEADMAGRVSCDCVFMSPEAIGA